MCIDHWYDRDRLISGGQVWSGTHSIDLPNLEQTLTYSSLQINPFTTWTQIYQINRVSIRNEYLCGLVFIQLWLEGTHRHIQMIAPFCSQDWEADRVYLPERKQITFFHGMRRYRIQDLTLLAVFVCLKIKFHPCCQTMCGRFEMCCTWSQCLYFWCWHTVGVSCWSGWKVTHVCGGFRLVLSTCGSPVVETGFGMSDHHFKKFRKSGRY